MDEQPLQSILGIGADDWEQTPVSVRKVWGQLEQRLEALEIENQQLREKINQNSGNSHSPPGSDPPNLQKEKKKKSRGKKRGGQPGHRGHSRPLYPVEDCASVTDHYPETGGGCGEELTGVDPHPHRHQVVEIPPIKLQIEEHRLHQLACPHGGEKTRAVLPEEVEASGYKERVVAIVSVLSGMYRHSHRMVVTAMWDLFGVKLSLGTVNRLRKEASEVEGLEPTNNAAERAIRPAVLWRRTSFGSQSEADRIFKAHCYFGLKPHSNTQDSLQHLKCYTNYGGSTGVLNFLLAELGSRG